MYSLNDCLEQQKITNSRFVESNISDKRKLSDMFLSAAIGEMAETYSELFCFSCEDDLIMECIDVLHFLLSSYIAISSGRPLDLDVCNNYEETEYMVAIALTKITLLREKTSKYSKWWKDRRVSIEELIKLNSELIGYWIKFTMLVNSLTFEGVTNAYFRKTKYNKVRKDWEVNSSSECRV